MDKVTEYLAERPEGATAEQIAREALGLTGAVGPVAAKVVRAAAEEDGRIAEGRDGLWTLRSKPKETGLRDTPFATLNTATREDGTLLIAVTRRSFDGETRTETFEVPASRTEASARQVEAFEAAIDGAVPADFRFARTRDAINRLTRLQVGRESVPAGLCLARLARRCFPETRISTCDDVAAAVGLPYVDVSDPAEVSRSRGELLMGLLERFAARDVTSVQAVRDDLSPTVTAVDFEAFAFDETYLDDLPATPGVYVMRDAEGDVIYVGKSVHLRDRVKTYFAKRSEREQKTLKILDRIWTVEVETVGSELEALILEARMIQATTPEFNKQVDVHERATGTKRDPFVIVLPSADTESVELFCVRPDREIGRFRARKDLADWPDRWSKLNAFFEADGGEVDEVEQAGHRILDGWLARKGDEVNTIDVGDAGEAENLRRLLEEQIRAADDEGWEKVWRV